MARIFWDTNLFIYLFENNPQWAPKLVDSRRKMLQRGDELLPSWLTVGEVLTKPKEVHNAVLEKSYLNFFTSGAVLLIPFDFEAAKRYSEIRSRSRIRPADSIQLACAAAACSDLFVTNDKDLSGLAIPGITFITSVERMPF
jgi:predicted nucleic acid-binding protein